MKVIRYKISSWITKKMFIWNTYETKRATNLLEMEMDKLNKK